MYTTDKGQSILQPGPAYRSYRFLPDLNVLFYETFDWECILTLVQFVIDLQQWRRISMTERLSAMGEGMFFFGVEVNIWR